MSKKIELDYPGEEERQGEAGQFCRSLFSQLREQLVKGRDEEDACPPILNECLTVAEAYLQMLSDEEWPTTNDMSAEDLLSLFGEWISKEGRTTV